MSIRKLLESATCLSLGEYVAPEKIEQITKTHVITTRLVIEIKSIHFRYGKLYYDKKYPRRLTLFKK